MNLPPTNADEEISRVERQPETARSPQEIYEARRDDYNKLLTSARLRALILENVDFKITPEALSADKTVLKRQILPTTKVMSLGLDDGTCMANVVWEVTFKLKNKNVVRCTASYIISYDGVQECAADGVTVFLQNVGKVATYAYFRALYAQLDWAATLGSDPLPVIQFLPNFRLDAEREARAEKISPTPQDTA